MDQDIKTSIYHALTINDLDTLKKYIQTASNPDKKYPAWLCLPLDRDLAPEIFWSTPPLISIATFYGSMSCIHFLLNNGAELSDTDDSGIFY